jgi:hypothetical protein
MKFLSYNDVCAGCKSILLDRYKCSNCKSDICEYCLKLINNIKMCKNCSENINIINGDNILDKIELILKNQGFEGHKGCYYYFYNTDWMEKLNKCLIELEIESLLSVIIIEIKDKKWQIKSGHGLTKHILILEGKNYEELYEIIMGNKEVILRICLKNKIHLTL